MEDGLPALPWSLEKNPLEDLRALREVSMVMCGGMLIRHPKVKRIPQIEEQLERLL